MQHTATTVLTKRFTGERDLIHIGIPRGDIVGIVVAGRLQHAPHEAAIILHGKWVKGGRVHGPGTAVHAIFPFGVQGVPGGGIDHSVPPGVINRGRTLHLGFDPSVAESSALEFDDEPIGGVVVGQRLLVFQDDVARHGWNKHARIGLPHDVKVVSLKLVKDSEEVLQELIQIGRRFLLRFWQWRSVGKARSDGVFDVQHGGGLGPGVVVVGQLGRAVGQAAVSRRPERLRDGRVFHHDAAVEGRTAGAPVEPNDQRILDGLNGGLKEPKHGFSDPSAVRGGQQACVHGAGEVGIRRFDVLQSLHEEVVGGLEICRRHVAVKVLSTVVCMESTGRSRVVQCYRTDLKQCACAFTS
jgi:hypothetical protein